MKLYILYTTNTPADRDIAYFQRKLAEVGMTSEMLDADSRSGSALASLYDVMQRPAAVLVGPDGQELEKWEGSLPRVEEVIPYRTAS